ncbi:hypothetical protein VZT92_010466 [Zoarces viviparus]
MMALGMAMTDRVQVDMPTGKEKTRLLDITPPTQALECPEKTAQELGEATPASAPPAPSTGLYPALPPTPPPYSSNNPFIQAPVRTVRGGLLTGGFQMALDKGCIIETASTPTERAVSGMMERVKKLERVIAGVPIPEGDEDPEGTAAAQLHNEDDREDKRQRELDQECLEQLRKDVTANTPRPMHSGDNNVARNLYHDPACGRQPSPKGPSGPNTFEKLSILRGEAEILQQTLDAVMRHSRPGEEDVPPTYQVSGTLHGDVSPITSGSRPPRPRHTMELRSHIPPHHENPEPWEEEEIGAYPLRAAPTPARPQRVQFVPFGFADMTSMVQQLPSLHAGADPWIELTEALTAGQQMAVGDLRALLSRCLDPTQCAALLHLAGAGVAPDATPFDQYRTALWQQLRTKFPTPVNQGAVAAFIWAPGESPPLYLARAERVWRLAFREPHDGSVTTVALWRAMVKRGLPDGPRQCMDAVVGLDAMTQEMWNAQLRHYLSTHIQAESSSDTEIKTLQKALLKKQLKELDTTEAIKKSKAKEQQQLVVQPAPAPPPPAPAPSVPLEVMMAMMSAGGEQSRPWVPKGQWGGRGGARGRGASRGRGVSYYCYNCGKQGHFARECRSAPQHTQRDRGQYSTGGGGRGYDRQGPQEGAHQAPWDEGRGHQEGDHATQANSQQWPGGYNSPPY